jgi:transcriptional regulator with XRE-family HTH domain
MPKNFVARLFKLCDTDNMAEVARCTGVSYNTLKNYIPPSERFPSAEILIQIAGTTGASIDWLLLGRGDVLFESREERIMDEKTFEIEIPSFSITMRFPKNHGEKIPLFKTGPKGKRKDGD